MTKREFIIQFVLNRTTADIPTDGAFWVEQANKAWNKLSQVAPDNSSESKSVDV